MPWLSPIFLFKIVSAVFKVFRKKEGKNPLFSCTITILDHTLYGKVKSYLKQELRAKREYILKNVMKFNIFLYIIFHQQNLANQNGAKFEIHNPWIDSIALPNIR